MSRFCRFFFGSHLSTVCSLDQLWCSATPLVCVTVGTGILPVLANDRIGWRTDHRIMQLFPAFDAWRSLAWLPSYLNAFSRETPRQKETSKWRRGGGDRMDADVVISNVPSPVFEWINLMQTKRLTSNYQPACDFRAQRPNSRPLVFIPTNLHVAVAAWLIAITWTVCTLYDR